MWIVRLALRRSHVFVVVPLLALVLGIVTIERMPVDVFLDVNIPVVTVVWSFTGMSTDEHMESQSMYGVGVTKIFFHPGVDIAEAQRGFATPVGGAGA